ncbi:efflux RND transporter periplasmic adaptor subunit [Uliginosibacterium sp. 31-12]|uniref:efflux RND transporter periplasmic adaptor subunit n=1 Tax=Uliginosibacterium sp. 31-12 TaxID=3062781 RepID=UPI0026E37CE1|nr:efflux RND transporter periplasmic adaptor subunit [Uliginosibacterium sp. 31-12]MDO6385924.1 efflux RND transporter periplasmic adaptor subunit [Uliginosibacterium sp. 31-12]
MRGTIMIGVAGLLASLLAGCDGKQDVAKAGPPPVPVRLEKSTRETVPVVTEFVGRAQAYRSVEIMARVEGILETRHFVEGSQVRKGDLLYSLERAPYEAALRDAEASLAKQKATAVNAASREARLAPLVKENAISQQEYDNAVASMKESEATVAAAESQVDRAKLNLEYTRILATESGRIGRSEMPEGRLVGKGSPTRLTVIDKLDPIYVSFTISDRDALAFRKALQSGAIQEHGDSVARIIMPDGSQLKPTGRIDFADIEVSESSGTIALRAVLPNPKAELLPGLFVRIELTSGESPNTILVPQQAVMKSPTGHYLWVVDAKGRAERRDVVVGKWQREKWAIDKGLGAGEMVVVEGGQKLSPGAQTFVPTPAAASAPSVSVPAAR